MSIEIIIIGLIAFLLGAGICFFIVTRVMKKKAFNYLEDAKAEAEVVKKEKVLQAKEKFLQLKQEHEKEINDKNSKIANTENRLKQKETSLNQKLQDVNKNLKENDAIKKNLEKQLGILEQKKNF